jgi:hypothetical protein
MKQLIIFLMFICTSVLAQDWSSDRPDQSDAPDVVGSGKVQLEMGISHSEVNDFVDNTSYGETLVRIGLTHSLELRLGYGGYNDTNFDSSSFGSDDTGSSDTSIGIKWKMREEEGIWPAMALIAATNLTTGEVPYGAVDAEPSAKVSAAHTLSESFGLTYNLGLGTVVSQTVTHEETTRFFSTYSVALGYSATERVGLFIEAFGDIPTSQPGGPSHAMDTGMTVRIAPNFQWDIAGGAGIDDGVSDWFATTGFAYHFGD